MIESEGKLTELEDLSAELLISIFDYLTSIEILVTFFPLNQRFRLIIFYYLQSGYRLTQLHLQHCSYNLYRRFCREILVDFQSTITNFHLGSSYHYGQIEEFDHFQLPRLDVLTIELIDSQRIVELLKNFLRYNRLQWFDRIHLIMNESTQGWNEHLPFCVQNIPVRELMITGKVPYVFAQHLLTGCYSITHLTIHLKYDHDLLPLLYYLPNLIQCHVCVDDRGRDISNTFSLLTSLPSLRQFRYQGLMPPVYLRRLILQINEHLEELILFTQDYQWPFQHGEGFSSEFFDLLPHLRTFHFYIRLISPEIFYNFTSSLNEMIISLVRKHFCENILWIQSKDIGQIFSVPFAFDQFEMFERDFFHQIQRPIDSSSCWSTIEHLTLHMNIYDPHLLKSIEDNFIRLRSIDYRVPHFSLVPEDHQLDQYDIELKTIRKLIIRDSVKHGCHVPQPLVLLTANLVELDIDHFYLMQILSSLSQTTQTRLFLTFAQLRRLTVRQFDERLSTYFFSSFPRVQIFTLSLTTYKMQIYRSTLTFLEPLLYSMPKLISLKFEHIKKPQEYHAYLQLQRNTREQLGVFFHSISFWSKWYDDLTQKSSQYATFLCST